MRLYNRKVGGLKVCQQRLVAVQLRAVIALIRTENGRYEEIDRDWRWRAARRRQGNPSSEANMASTEGPTHIEAARIPSEMQTWRQIGGFNIVDLNKGSCPWALAEHLHVINGQLGWASGLLGPQSSRTLDFHIPLDLSPSVRLVHLDEGSYGVTGRPTAGSSLTEDTEAQDKIHLNSTTGMENPMMHVIQTPLLVSPTQRTVLPRKGSKQKRMLELQHADLAFSVTKKIKKGDGGIPRQDKTRFRNLCV
ncbi:hypothetical protein ACFX1X_033003 [Malus domestica]